MWFIQITKFARDLSNSLAEITIDRKHIFALVLMILSIHFFQVLIT